MQKSLKKVEGVSSITPRLSLHWLRLITDLSRLYQDESVQRSSSICNSLTSMLIQFVIMLIKEITDEFQHQNRIRFYIDF